MFTHCDPTLATTVVATAGIEEFPYRVGRMSGADYQIADSTMVDVSSATRSAPG
jgi:hypothetical protein